jgi:hypothetical protein
MGVAIARGGSWNRQADVEASKRPKSRAAKAPWSSGRRVEQREGRMEQCSDTAEVGSAGGRTSTPRRQGNKSSLDPRTRADWQELGRSAGSALWQRARSCGTLAVSRAPLSASATVAGVRAPWQTAVYCSDFSSAKEDGKAGQRQRVAMLGQTASASTVIP